MSRTASANIHSTAIIHKSAEIAGDVVIGPYAVIGAGVRIGEGVQIDSHTVLEHATIGKRCHLFPSAFIGTAPQDMKYRGEPTHVEIGDETIIRECATVNRGTREKGLTRIGKNCLLMAYSHVAHDCTLGEGVTLANSVALAGHVEVGDFAVLGGMVGVHQFVRVGKLSMLGAGAMVPLDVPPYTQAQGDRARLVGLNLVGLKRRGIGSKAAEEIKGAYRSIFSSGLTLVEAMDQIEAQTPGPEVKYFIDFIRSSQRGICRPAKKIVEIVEEED